MSVTTIPTKTPLGHEEMRRRTGGLGQRHRTILFLIDGRRPLSEVLSLALKAGAATSHFEDLVRMGFVGMPPEEPPAAPPVELRFTPAQAQITELAGYMRQRYAPGRPAWRDVPEALARVRAGPAHP